MSLYYLFYLNLASTRSRKYYYLGGLSRQAKTHDTKNPVKDLSLQKKCLFSKPNKGSNLLITMATIKVTYLYPEKLMKRKHLLIYKGEKNIERN